MALSQLMRKKQEKGKKVCVFAFSYASVFPMKNALIPVATTNSLSASWLRIILMDEGPGIAFPTPGSGCGSALIMTMLLLPQVRILVTCQT